MKKTIALAATISAGAACLSLATVPVLASTTTHSNWVVLNKDSSPVSRQSFINDVYFDKNGSIEIWSMSGKPSHNGQEHLFVYDHGNISQKYQSKSFTEVYKKTAPDSQYTFNKNGTPEIIGNMKLSNTWGVWGYTGTQWKYQNLNLPFALKSNKLVHVFETNAGPIISIQTQSGVPDTFMRTNKSWINLGSPSAIKGSRLKLIDATSNGIQTIVEYQSMKNSSYQFWNHNSHGWNQINAISKLSSKAGAYRISMKYANDGSIVLYWVDKSDHLHLWLYSNNKTKPITFPLSGIIWPSMPAVSVSPSNRLVLSGVYASPVSSKYKFSGIWELTKPI